MGLTRPRADIIGGKGRMGSWFSRFLSGHGVEVSRAGSNTKLGPREMIRQCNVIVVSVPIAAAI